MIKKLLMLFYLFWLPRFLAEESNDIRSFLIFSDRFFVANSGGVITQVCNTFFEKSKISHVVAKSGDERFGSFSEGNLKLMALKITGKIRIG